MFNTILVALDGSDHARHALKVAVGLAERCGAKLLLCHAIEPHPLRSDLSRIASEAAEEMYERIGGEVAERVLGDAEQAAREAGIAEIGRVVQEGSAAPAIVAAADHEGADLIVVGTRGLTGLHELALGSVAHNVTAMAHCPVVVVK
ncbi:MAG: universal stress protein [Gammaproteobacteria bacterium]